MGLRIPLQLAVLAYVAIALSHQKYLLVEVDDNEDEKPSPEISSEDCVETNQSPTADMKIRTRLWAGLSLWFYIFLINVRDGYEII